MNENVMLLAGGKEIISLSTLTILLVVTVLIVLLALHLRVRRRRRAAALSRPPVGDRAVGVEISLDQFDLVNADLELLLQGDGRDAEGRPFGIYRYRARTTGKIYDYSVGAKATRAIEYPAPEPPMPRIG